MGVEGGMKIVKYLLFIFNLLFFLIGLVLIIMGAVVQTKFRAYLQFFPGNMSVLAILIIVVGIIILIVGFFGCFGAIKENHCMILTFAVLVLIIFILEIGCGIAAFVKKDAVVLEIKNIMHDGMVKYDPAADNGVTKAWNFIQQSLHCCGAYNFCGWGEGTTFSHKYKHMVPASCCKSNPEYKGCGNNTIPFNLAGKEAKETTCEKQAHILNGKEKGTFEPQRKTDKGCVVEHKQPVVNQCINQVDVPMKINTEGCVDSIIGVAMDNIAAVGGIGVAFAVLELLGIILACLLARSIRKNYQAV